MMILNIIVAEGIFMPPFQSAGGSEYVKMLPLHGTFTSETQVDASPWQEGCHLVDLGDLGLIHQVGFTGTITLKSVKSTDDTNRGLSVYLWIGNYLSIEGHSSAGNILGKFTPKTNTINQSQTEFNLLFRSAGTYHQYISIGLEQMYGSTAIFTAEIDGVACDLSGFYNGQDVE